MFNLVRTHLRLKFSCINVAFSPFFFSGVDRLFKRGVSKISEMPALEDVSKMPPLIETSVEEVATSESGEQSSMMVETIEGARGQQSDSTPEVPPPRLTEENGSVYPPFLKLIFFVLGRVCILCF